MFHRSVISILLMVVVVLSTGCPLPTCEMDVTHIRQEKRLRSYYTYVPESVKAGGQASFVVIALHGFGQTGEGMAKLTGLNELADEFNCVVVYPNGVSRRWNYDLVSIPGSVLFPELDDVAFIDEVAGAVRAAWNLTPAQTFITGFSNGAFMAQRYAIERGESLGGIATVAGTLAEDVATTLTPTAELPVLHIHGLDDPQIPFEGGDIAQGPGQTASIVSARDLIAIWTSVNECVPLPSPEDLPDADPNDGTTTSVESYGPCHSENELKLYVVDGGGHTWPGHPGGFPEVVVGLTALDFDASTVILDFFAAASGE